MRRSRSGRPRTSSRFTGRSVAARGLPKAVADDNPAMSEFESGEESIDESGRNPTQQRLDEEEPGGPSDVSWDDERFGELPEDEPEPS